MINKYIIENWHNSIRKASNKNGLPSPYAHTVPCIDEKFTCFFYWDTYFTNLGLLYDCIEQAKNNLQNMKYFVETMGYIPNGNERVMFNRSQPPLYPHAVRDYYRYTNDNNVVLEHYESMKTEYAFWMRERMTEIGLNQYNATPSEKEILDFYNELKSRNGFSALQREKESILPYFAEAESGWDFSPRFDGKALHFVQADLNGILYGTERFLEECAVLLNKPSEAMVFAKAAQKRKGLMDKYLKGENGFYYDYDFINGRRSSLVTCAGFVPFAMEMDNNQKACQQALEQLEFENGISVGDKNTGNQGFQWAYPNMWAPLVYWAYQASKKCGLQEAATRILQKYMNTVEQNFEATGALWEKYDAITGGISNLEYNSPKMLGWTAGVYRYFYSENKQK